MLVRPEAVIEVGHHRYKQVWSTSHVKPVLVYITGISSLGEPSQVKNSLVTSAEVKTG